MKVMVINGPNLNMLGYRDNNIYGKKTIEQIDLILEEDYKNVDFTFYQSNIEGEIIEFIHEAIIKDYQGIVINPGAYSHYSYAIYDALLMYKGIKIEVHLSDVLNREEFRKVLITSKACDELIKGLGYKGYKKAIEKILTDKGEE